MKNLELLEESSVGLEPRPLWREYSLCIEPEELGWGTLPNWDCGDSEEESLTAGIESVYFLITDSISLVLNLFKFSVSS